MQLFLIVHLNAYLELIDFDGVRLDNDRIQSKNIRVLKTNC